MEVKTWKYCVPKRYIILFMTFLGYANVTLLHINLSMVVMDITTVKNVTTLGVSESKAEFNWTTEQKGLILGSYSYGRLCSPIGGLLAARLGGSTISNIGSFAMAAITLLSPFLLSTDFTLVFIMYVIFGAFESFLFVGIPEAISHWAPINERCRFVSCSQVGIFFGSIISFLLSGFLLEKCNWRTSFYVMGFASFTRVIIWWLVVKNDPSEDKFLSEAELKYIQDGMEHRNANEKLVYPWKRILTFVPLWIASLAQFSVVSGFIFTSVFLPQYIEDTTGESTSNTGFISTIPQICAVISMPVCGFFADYIRSLNKLSITNLHKLFFSITLLCSVLCYTVVAVCSAFIVNIASISLFQFTSTLLVIDLTVLFLDISPNYVAILVSIVNFCSIISGFVVPALVEFIVTSHSSAQWKICFVLYSSLCLFSAFICMKFILRSSQTGLWSRQPSMEAMNLI